jgi:hypothetical protein
MATTIVTKSGSGAPTASNLVAGELAVDLTNKRLYTENSSGTVLELGTNPASDVTFGDNTKAVFGDGSDLRIYHTGSHSTIENIGTGHLQILTTDFRLKDSAGTESMILANADGNVQLYYNNAEKLATTATGIDVTGTVTGTQFSSTSSSAALPSFGVTAGNGMYNPATNAIGWSTNSVERMRIDSSGNVGIGTSSFNATYAPRLQVTSAASDGTGGVLIQNYLPTLTLEDISGGAAASQIQQDQTNMLFKNNGATRMTIDASGRVGIGVVPSTIWSSSYDALQIGLGGSVYAHGGAGSNMHMAANSVYEGIAPNYYDKYLTSSTASKYAQDSGLHIWSTAASGTAGDAITWSEAMRIDSIGNVGIGTSAPSQVLHLSTASTSYALAETTGTGTSAGFRMKGSASADYTLFTTQGTNQFAIYDNAAGAERMRIDSSGNLGIGVSPSSKLDINISTNARGYFADNIGEVTSGTFCLQVVNSANAALKPLGFRAEDIRFATGSSERMRIDASGNLLVGTTSTADTDVGAKIFSGGRMVQGFAGTELADMHDFYRGTAGSLSRVGNIRTNATTTTYNTSSDERLKENITDANDAGDKIDAIQVRQYDWKADGSHQDYGMVAQELLEVAPEAVSASEDPEEMMGVDYSKLVPMMLKEIQSLRARVAQLES